MQNPQKQYLTAAMIFSAIMGVIPTLFSVLFFFFCWHGLQAETLEGDPAATFDKCLDLLRTIIFGALPVMGYGFFLVVYMVWKSLRISQNPNNGQTDSAKTVGFAI